MKMKMRMRVRVERVASVVRRGEARTFTHELAKHIKITHSCKKNNNKTNKLVYVEDKQGAVIDGR